MRQDGRRQTVCSAAMVTSSMIFVPLQLQNAHMTYDIYITYELKVLIYIQLHLFLVFLIKIIPIF